MRIHIPATFPQLVQLAETGVMPVRSATAFAVTPALREAYVRGDDEELADVAFREAARASLRLLAAGDANDTPGHDRRCVVSADVPDEGAAPRPDLDDAVVRLDEPRVTLGQVVAVHVDLAGAVEAVRRAVAVVDEADLGDEEAEFIVGDAEDQPLAWYDVAELPFLVDLL